jgi:predicted ATPase
VLNAVRLAARRQEIDAGDVLLHFFSREASVLQPHVDTLTVGRDGMLPSWPAGFFDQWDQALDELLS